MTYRIRIRPEPEPLAYYKGVSPWTPVAKGDATPFHCMAAARRTQNRLRSVLAQDMAEIEPFPPQDPTDPGPSSRNTNHTSRV